MGKSYCLATVIGILVHCIVLAQPGITQVDAASTRIFSGNTDSLLHKDTTVKKTLFVISDIFITGAKKTKSYIIERELPFKTGDSVVLNELVSKFELGKNQLMNTRLFNEV